MANDTTTKVTDLNEAEQVAENDVFLLTHSNGLSEKVTAETLFKNGSKTIVLTRAEYDALGGDYKQDAIYAISDESTGGINVDQTYDPEGVNPLSGQAVNGALTEYAQKKLKKKTLTISFNLNGDYYVRIKNGIRLQLEAEQIVSWIETDWSNIQTVHNFAIVSGDFVILVPSGYASSNCSVVIDFLYY